MPPKRRSLRIRRGGRPRARSTLNQYRVLAPAPIVPESPAARCRRKLWEEKARNHHGQADTSEEVGIRGARRTGDRTCSLCAQPGARRGRSRLRGRPPRRLRRPPKRLWRASRLRWASRFRRPPRFRRPARRAVRALRPLRPLPQVPPVRLLRRLRIRGPCIRLRGLSLLLGSLLVPVAVPDLHLRATVGDPAGAPGVGAAAVLIDDPDVLVLLRRRQGVLPLYATVPGWVA